MSQPLSEISQQKAISGLDTFTHTAAATRVYKLHIRATVMPPSGLTIQIKQNSTVVASTSISSAGQQTIQLEANISAIAGDIMSFVLTSSNSNDSAPNAVRATARIQTED